jgi:hypothetical protein
MGRRRWSLATYSEGQVTGDGTSLNVLDRQTDGNWLIRICGPNSGEPQITHILIDYISLGMMQTA